MKSLTQKLSRQNTVAIKILFKIEIRKINFPYSGDLENESLFSVCFERGGKIATSTDRQLFRLHDGSMEVFFNETLSLVVTMYRNPNNEYQDKEGKLIIRQRRKVKTTKKGDYLGIGICAMNLAKLCQSDQLVTFNLPITQCSYPEASISVGIMAKAIGECNDDALSLDSGFSEPISDIAAEFDVSQKDKSRFPSSLPAYPSSLSPLPQPRATSKDIPPTAISASNQFFALLSSHPELQRKWSEVERELIELQEKYRVVLQQKTELAESLFREKEKNKQLEEEMKSLKSTRSGGKTLDNRTVAAHLFSQVPDTPSTTDVLGNTDSSGLRKPSIDEDTEFFMSRSISADVSKTPTRSILKMDSNSFRTPSEKTSAPIRSISTSRSVSFRNTRTASESAAPSPLNPASSRAKTLPASQLTESLADYKLTHPSTQTPSRKQSMAGGPSPALLLEENSQLQKQLAKMKLFAQETDSLNKENQIEIQFLVEGKQRMLLEIKTLKEKYENAKTKIVDLEQKLIESERRGRGKGRVELIQDEVHEEILLTKIQLERENCQLKEEYEQVERENIKLKKRIEDMEKGNSSLKSDPELLATQKEIQTLRDLLRGRDLQILQLCLPQNAPPTLHQLYSHPSSSPTTPTISPRKDENEESMSPDTGRDSLHLTQELSQLISESNLLSQAALIPPSPSALLSSTPPSNASQGESLIQDMNEVVCDLVSSKLKIASLLTQLDVEGLKHQLLKTRLAKYATRVSQLEVENISLYSQINTLSSPGVPMQERRGSWYPAWLKKFL